MFNMPRFSNFWHAFTVVCIYFSKVQERLVLLILFYDWFYWFIYSWNACFISSRNFSHVLLQPSESVLLYSSKGIQYHIIQHYQYHITGSFPTALMISKRVLPHPPPLAPSPSYTTKIYFQSYIAVYKLYIDLYNSRYLPS